MRLPAAALLVAVAAPAVAQLDWKTYRNERFGSTAEVPADWAPGSPPANGDGLRFTSPDGLSSVAVSGSLQTFEALDAAFAAFEQPQSGETITYHRRSARWLVVSGLRGGRIFYRKLTLSCGGRIWNGIDIDYP